MRNPEICPENFCEEGKFQNRQGILEGVAHPRITLSLRAFSRLTCQAKSGDCNNLLPALCRAARTERGKLADHFSLGRPCESRYKTRIAK